MAPLSTDLRKRLEHAVKEARRVAEPAGRQALETLAVDRREAHGSMSPDDRALRTRLRAHGRQLGDARDPRTGAQTIDRLAHEVAYEQWHRMLFARFLAENQLLIEPESGVPISMGECEELAREQGDDPWALAGRTAARMLPRIFRPDDPALAATLAPETRRALERLLESLPPAVFTANDSLGWTYQFWQAERKDAVNKSGVKIGADELPAVTQLFTEHYMVLFLFHNTIGAWRAGKILAERPEVAESATTEDELRRTVRLNSQGGYDFSYLRFVREAREGDDDDTPTGPWRPAAGTFDGWPRDAAELRVLDPCCGSGHFLIEGFELLVRLRMEEEGRELEDAIRAVLADNLFGLEIDPRCTQIAAFNLALAAWKLAGRPTELPPLNIACSGLAPNATKDEWLTLAERMAAAGGMPPVRDLLGTEDTLLSGPLRTSLGTLYDLFEEAPALGSLIDPGAVEADLLQVDFGAVQPLLATLLENEKGNDEQVERAVAAQGMALAAVLLTERYTLVITNVPYLGLRAMQSRLKIFCSRHYQHARHDLANVMLERFALTATPGGSIAAVSPQAWLFAGSFEAFRSRWLNEKTWNSIARLGPRAFDGISGEVVNVALVVVTERPPYNAQIAGIDCEAPRGAVQKSKELNSSEIAVLSQRDQLFNPDQRILLSRQAAATSLLREKAVSLAGIQNGDSPMYQRRLWEVVIPSRRWVMQQTVSKEGNIFSGFDTVLDFDQENGHLRAPAAWRRQALHDSDQRGKAVWGRTGVLASRMGDLPCTLYLGNLFDQASAAIVPKHQSHVAAVWAFCSSPHFLESVRRIDKKLNVTSATLAKVPFDLVDWHEAANRACPHGLPEPQSNDPTQWLFHGHPAGMLAAGPTERSPWGIADPVGADRHPSLICREPNLDDVLQVGVARLLGYRWPPEHDPEMRLDEAARAWVERARDLDEYADPDGIVCLTPIRGERSAADRLRRLLGAAFGDVWSASRERELLAAAAGDGKPAGSLEAWLRDRFFEQHCKRFHHRPFVWHLWDGRKDGFHAFVSYHRLAGPDGEARRTLEALTYSSLGDWINRQQAAQREGAEGADARLAAAQDLQTQLERILSGEPPCDLFVRWKPLHRQPIGWDPDIDDGVRLNIRPFMSAELRKGGRKGAGILRWKPNITWKKDRGKEPKGLRPREEFPWFWSCPGDGSLTDRTDFPGGDAFDGNRWNDLHYTSAAKRATRVGADEEDEQ